MFAAEVLRLLRRGGREQRKVLSKFQMNSHKSITFNFQLPQKADSCSLGAVGVGTGHMLSSHVKVGLWLVKNPSAVPWHLTQVTQVAPVSANADTAAMPIVFAVSILASRSCAAMSRVRLKRSRPNNCEPVIRCRDSLTEPVSEALTRLKRYSGSIRGTVLSERARERNSKWKEFMDRNGLRCQPKASAG